MMQSVRIALFTWNVGGAGGVPNEASELLCEAGRNVDVIVVGLQEVPIGRRGWKRTLRTSLAAEWIYAGGQTYAGLRVRVFVRDHVWHYIRIGAGMRVGVGVADRWPNKGAVAIELTVGTSCRMCFVVAHLAANEDMIRERQDDWITILRRLDNVEMLTARTTDAATAIPLFHRYDHVFFMGDLNYRLTPPGASHADRMKWVKQRIVAKDWSALASIDQLVEERGKRNVFVNFEEAPVLFPPTFKFEPDTTEYSKARVPSYCDRILWHSLPSRRPLVRCLKYSSLSQFISSDHRPVQAVLHISAPIVRIPRPTMPNSSLRIVVEFQLIRIHSRPPRDLTMGSTTSSSRTLRSPPPSDVSTEGNTSSLLIESRPPFIPCSDSPGEEVFPGGQAQSKSLSADILDDYDADDFDEADDPDDDDDDDDDYDELAQSPLTDMYPETEGPHVSNGSAEKKGIGRRLGTIPADDEDDTEESGDSSDEIRAMLAPRQTRTATKIENNKNYKLPSGGMVTARLSGGERFRMLHSDMSSRGGGRDSSRSQASYNALKSFAAFSSVDSSDDPSKSLHGMTADVDVGPRKRYSLSKQILDAPSNGSKDKRPFLRGLRMEVHGPGLFLKADRVYRVGIPKVGTGIRERIGESLPVIPLALVEDVDTLRYQHIVLAFGRSGSRVGHSGVLPLRDLLEHQNKPYAFDLDVTKYGAPGRRVEACVQLVVSHSSNWIDSKRRIVRCADGSSAKNYKGRDQIRAKTKAKTVPAQAVRT